MDRRDSQSSLPSSLIPHLYAAPRDSSTRTTLTSHSDDSDRDGSSLPSLPPIPRYIRPRSSYPSFAYDRQLPPVHPAYPSYRSLEPSSNPHRSVSSSYSNQTLFFPSPQPSESPTSILLPSLASLSADIFSRNSSWREGEAGPSSLIHPGQREYDSRNASQPARVISPPNTFGYGSTSHRRDYPTFSHQVFFDRPISPLPPLQHVGSNAPPLMLGRRFSYPEIGSMSISDSNYSRQVSTPEIEPSYGSEPVEGGDARKNKKQRRAHSLVNDIPKKTSRKTAVACNFCRGRKLRCNGATPTCYNCTVRNFECEYVSTQRRRGPGKAKKGSRSKKGRSEPSVGDRLPTMVPDYDVSPDLRPFISILSLESFEFQPPERRSRGTSSAEDRSDAKGMQPGS